MFRSSSCLCFCLVLVSLDPGLLFLVHLYVFVIVVVTVVCVFTRLYVVGYRLHVCFKPCLAFELWCLPLSLVPFSSPSFWFVGAPFDVLIGEFVPSKLIDLSFR